jgi:hypothetical protein
MKLIYLTKTLITVVDDDDFDRFRHVKWTAKHNGMNPGRFYAYNGDLGYLHRCIMAPPEGLLVDHINGYGLDNRRENLRLATHGLNMHNTPARNQTGFKGVRKGKGGRFVAYLTFDKIQKTFDVYNTPEEAARAHDRAALERYGANARLNFPQRDGEAA